MFDPEQLKRNLLSKRKSNYGRKLPAQIRRKSNHTPWEAEEPLKERCLNFNDQIRQSAKVLAQSKAKREHEDWRNGESRNTIALSKRQDWNAGDTRKPTTQGEMGTGNGGDWRKILEEEGAGFFPARRSISYSKENSLILRSDSETPLRQPQNTKWVSNLRSTVQQRRQSDSTLTREKVAAFEGWKRTPEVSSWTFDSSLLSSRDPSEGEPPHHHLRRHSAYRSFTSIAPVPGGYLQMYSMALADIRSTINMDIYHAQTLPPHTKAECSQPTVRVNASPSPVVQAPQESPDSQTSVVSVSPLVRYPPPPPMHVPLLSFTCISSHSLHTSGVIWRGYVTEPCGLAPVTAKTYWERGTKAVRVAVDLKVVAIMSMEDNGRLVMAQQGKDVLGYPPFHVLLYRPRILLNRAPCHLPIIVPIALVLPVQPSNTHYQERECL